MSSSRMSLAASVALILGGCWFLSSILGTTPSANRGMTLDGGSASSKPMHNLLKQSPKHTQTVP